MSARLAANLSALSAAILFGASVVAVRVAVQEVPPLSLAVLRFGQGGLLLFLALVLWSGGCCGSSSGRSRCSPC